MSDKSPLPTTTRAPSTPTALARMAGALAVAAFVVACSGGGLPSPTTVPPASATPTPTGTPAVTPTETPTATATETASATESGAAVTMPPGTPMLVDPFTSAGIATTVDTAAHAVDPSTYRTTIPSADYSVVYVVFALKPDTVGKVTMVMTLNDVEVLKNPLTIDYGTKNSWGDFKINFPSSGIPTGVYKAVMTYEPTGAQVTQFFLVE